MIDNDEEGRGSNPGLWSRAEDQEPWVSGAATLASSPTRPRYGADRTPLMYPGITVISFITPGSPMFVAATDVADSMANSAVDGSLAWLPSASLHMTHFDLRVYGSDSHEEIGVSAEEMREVDRAMHTAFVKVAPPPALKMRPAGLQIRSGRLEISLRPATAGTGAEIARYREDLCATTGVRRADHDHYSYHISLAYAVGDLGGGVAGSLAQLLEHANDRVDTVSEFELEGPRLCVFDTVAAFLPWERRDESVSRKDGSPG